MELDNDKHIDISGGLPPTDEEETRNTPLRAGYDYSQYAAAITGFTGVNLQRITVSNYSPAVRIRVGPRGNFKGAVAQLSDHTLILAVCRRVTAAGLFGIHVYTSSDRGDTWTEVNETELFGKEMSLTALTDDSLLMTVESKAFVEDITQMVYYRSSDRGRTWRTDTINNPTVPRRLVVEDDGSLLMVRALRSQYLDYLYGDVGVPFAPSPHLEIARSSDGGDTWSFSEGKVDWDNCRFGETCAVRCADGTLLCALRSNPPGTHGEGGQVTYLSRSTDQGATWSTPWIMGNTAEVQVHLLLLGDGRLLATYTNYHLPFGIWAIVSSDNGNTWSFDRPIQLAMSADCYTGWGSTVELDNGELVTCCCVCAYVNEPREPGGAERNVHEIVRWRLPY